MNGNRIPSLFKSRSPKQFEFRPRYYNADKEAREARIRQLEREVNGTGDYDPEGFRMKLQERWRSNQKSGSGSASSIRLIAIAIALFALAFYMLY